ncbi:MAG: hypothetical protein V2A70_03420, partial [Candidatus Omnitrophota bacterium]
MRIKTNRNYTQQSMNNLFLTFIFTLIINVMSSVCVYAQFSGGEQSATAQAIIGSDIFTGGEQTGSVSATSGIDGSLSYGTATHISFLVSPSSTKHSTIFERQPVVAVLDANGNVVTGDNTTSVTVAIQNNPGAATLNGTTTVVAVNGLVKFTDLRLSRAGEMYTLSAQAQGFSAAYSESFDVFAGTGAKFAAVWDTAASAFFIYSWVESDNNRMSLTSTDTCHNHTILRQNSSSDATETEQVLSMKVNETKGWCEPNSFTTDKWQPTNSRKSYMIEIDISYDGTQYTTYSPLDITSMQLAGANWDSIADMKASLDKVNWDDIGDMSKKGINWDDVLTMSTSAVNWEYLGVLRSDIVAIKNVTDQMANVNWANAEVLTKSGIQWADVGAMTAAGINWVDLYQMTTQGVNWQDIDVLTQIGVNWNDFGVMSKVAVNWYDISRMTSDGINWADVAVLARTGINWYDLEVMTVAGANWHDFAIMTGAGVNWPDRVNWESLAALTT